MLEAEAKLVAEESALHDVERRLEALEQEAHAITDPPTVLADFAHGVSELRACVQGLRRERDDVRSELSKHGGETRQRKCRTMADLYPDLVSGDTSLVVVNKSIRDPSSMIH